jgi:hypothetical protein
LLRGRDFDARRDDQAAVAIINQAMAQRLFGGSGPKICRSVRVITAEMCEHLASGSGAVVPAPTTVSAESPSRHAESSARI